MYVYIHTCTYGHIYIYISGTYFLLTYLIFVYVCVCVFSHTHVQVMSNSFVTPWTSPPGFSVPGISQTRILEWIAISFSMGSSKSRDQTHISCIAGGFFTTEPPGNEYKYACVYVCVYIYIYFFFFISSVQLLSHVRLFATP